VPSPFALPFEQPLARGSNILEGRSGNQISCGGKGHAGRLLKLPRLIRHYSHCWRADEAKCLH
jgi:hypothetical protein